MKDCCIALSECYSIQWEYLFGGTDVNKPRWYMRTENEDIFINFCPFCGTKLPEIDDK